MAQKSWHDSVPPLRSITTDWIIQSLYSLKHQKEHGLRSGFNKLDQLIGEFFQDGILVSGSPGEGKSLLVLNLAVSFAMGEHVVLYLDTENDERHILKRCALVCLASLSLVISRS